MSTTTTGGDSARRTAPFPRGTDRTKDHHDDGDRGAVTVETAIVLPAIVLLLAVLLSCGAAAMLQVRCEEAAGAAARVLARGESPRLAEQEAQDIAGDRARVEVDLVRDRATAEVMLPAPGILGEWGALDLSASATTYSEEVIVSGG